MTNDTMTNDIPPYNPPKGKKREDFKSVVNELVISDSVKEATYEFIEMRKKIKSPMTPYAVELMLKKLNRMSDDPDIQTAILNQSIESGWKSIYELREKPKNTVCNSMVLDGVQMYDKCTPEIELNTDTKLNIKKNTYSREIPDIVDYLNQAVGKHFRPDSKATVKVITARLDEGYKVEDFYTIIDNKKADWLDDPKFDKFLQPDTLFSAKHFEGYLNQKPRKLTTNDLSKSIDFMDYMD